METTFDAVILANGTFPTHPVPLGILSRATRIVACDGAIAALAEKTGSSLLLQSPPTSITVIGDGDSVPKEFRHLLIKVDEQDDNDLTKATRYCLSSLSLNPRTASMSPLSRDPAPTLAYLGCTGGREDHTLGNIALLMRYYREMGVEGRMFTDHGLFTPARGRRAFSSFPGQQVSIFNFGCSSLHSEGLKWQSYPYREWWQGTLNEAIADTFTLHADGCYMVFQTFASKGHREHRRDA